MCLKTIFLPTIFLEFERLRHHNASGDGSKFPISGKRSCSTFFFFKVVFSFIQSMLRIAAIDIGRKNFAHHVEDVLLTGSQGIFELEEDYARLPRLLKRRVGGPLSSEITALLDRVCQSGKTVHQDVVDLRADPTFKKLDLATRDNLFGYLQHLYSLWKTCDLVVIEQQYFSTFTPRGRRGKKTEANIDAIKLAECCYSWFRISFSPEELELVFYGAQNKTKILGAPPSLSKYQRKAWAISKLKQLLSSRNEGHVWSALLERKKKTKQKLDDIADCVVMTQAYKFQKMVALW